MEGCTYNIGMGCCEPVLAPIQNYYTKSQIDRMMSGITVSGVTVEELNAAIESAKTEIEAEIPTVPTQVSAFENDVPYLTEHQSLSAYSTTQEMNEAIASAKTEVESEIPSLEGYATQQWVEDKHYITGVDLSDYATTAYVESEISAQTGDFVDGEELSSYTYDKATIDSKIASGGGSNYSAGIGINIDSANTITGVYKGYLSFDAPQSALDNFSGEAYIKAPWIDCQGSTGGTANFYTVDNAEDYRYNFKFIEPTKTFEVIEYPAGKENDWQDYFTIEFDEECGLFKLTTIQQIAYAYDAGCVRFFRIGDEYSDYSFKFSGTTEDAFNGIVSNFDNYVSNTNFWANENKIYCNVQKVNNGNSSEVKLIDLEAKNNTIKTNISVGLGVSTWTQVEFNGTCQLNGEVKSPVFRLSGDTSDLANFEKHWFNTSWYVELSRYGTSFDSLNWNGEEFVLESSWFGENGQFGTATVTYDPTENTVTVAYPLTAIVYGEPDDVKIRDIYSTNCCFVDYIKKFEYFAEEKQPLEPYLKETRNALTSHTSNSEIHVTTAQTASWDAKSDFSGSYTDLTNKPTIPVIWSGTQADFDLISPKDPNTIYLVY